MDPTLNVQSEVLRHLLVVQPSAAQLNDNSNNNTYDGEDNDGDNDDTHNHNDDNNK